MRVARIITSQQHGTDEDELKRQLQAAGYEVEVAAPGEAGTRPADLEVELQTLPADQALQTAARMAREGADILVAPGTLALEAAPAPVVAEAPAIMPEPQAAAADAQPHAEAEIAVEAPRAPSVLQRVGAAWAERQQRHAAEAEERRLERERRAREEEERRRQQALEAQRRREQEERARAERQRSAREQMAREAALRAERVRQIEENQRRRAAALKPQPVVPAPQPRPLALQAQTQAPPAAAKRAAAAPRPASVRARRVPAPRRISSRRDRQWQRAALLASLVALMAMLGFALAMNVRPVAPMPAQMLHNSAQQQVPFGAATITPAKPASAAPVRAAAPAATAARATTPPAARRAPRPSAAREAPVRPTPRARRSANDDEVVVRHFSSSSTARAQSPGIRRYSDQN